MEKLRNKDCTIKSLVLYAYKVAQRSKLTRSSQFVSFLDLIAFRLQRAGFNVSARALTYIVRLLTTRSAGWKVE